MGDDTARDSAKAGQNALSMLKAPLRVAARPVRSGARWLRRRRWVRRLATQGFRSGFLAIGERNGYGIPGRWITVDVADADFTVDLRGFGRLPFGDASQDVVYSAHTIEHLDDASLARLFDESHRVLRPGGYARFETVDAEQCVRAYREDDEGFFAYFIEEHRRNLVEGLGCSTALLEPHNILVGTLSCYIDSGRQIGVVACQQDVNARLGVDDLDAFGRWCVSLQTPEQYRSGGHVNCLYFSKLARMLTAAGFSDVVHSRNGVTCIPGLRLRGIERPHRAFYSVYIEARKSGPRSDRC